MRPEHGRRASHVVHQHGDARARRKRGPGLPPRPNRSRRRSRPHRVQPPGRHIRASRHIQAAATSGQAAPARPEPKADVPAPAEPSPAEEPAGPSTLGSQEERQGPPLLRPVLGRDHARQLPPARMSRRSLSLSGCLPTGSGSFAQPTTTLCLPGAHDRRLCLANNHDHVRFAANVARAAKQRRATSPGALRASCCYRQTGVVRGRSWIDESAIGPVWKVSRHSPPASRM